MEQLVLDLAAPVTPAFSHVIARHHPQIVRALTEMTSETPVYLWGLPGGGKTHLLQAWVEHAQRIGRAALYLDGREDAPLPDFAREAHCVAVDHVDDLTAENQIILFSIFNTLKETKGCFLAAGNVAPQRLQLRDDLRSRLAWGLVFELPLLSDDEKIAVLREYASSRMFDISDDVLLWLFRHWRRDLASLIKIIELLDHYSLALKRPVTLAFVKDLFYKKEKHPSFDQFL